VYETEVFFEELGATPDSDGDLLDEVWRPEPAVAEEGQVLEDEG
jgi:hypothetical protein